VIARVLSAAVAVLVLSGVPALAQTPVKWTIDAGPSGGVPRGPKFDVHVNATIEAGWHLYAIAQPPGGPQSLVVTVPAKPFVLAAAVVEPRPRSAMDPNFNLETFFHETSVSIAVPVGVAARTAAGTYPLTVEVLFQTCNARLCLPPATVALQSGVTVRAISATEGVTAVVAAASPSAAPDPSLDRPPSAPEFATSAEGVPRAPVKDMAAANRADTLGAYVSLAALMGALSLLTPCVFPMVPITVSYFSNRAARSRRDAVTSALFYGLGIVLTFTALGFVLAVGFGAAGLNQFAANPWLNLGIAALFGVFALSLFGLYEVALPARLVTRAATADAGRGRYTGTLLMGLAFTLTSFTCTAPFLGTLLVVASQGEWLWPMAGMLAFSSVFALPFVVLALVPGAISALPRSGPWMVTLKAAMGVLEMAAAIKFLSNVDLVWGWGVFTRPAVLVMWALLTIWLVLYLAGIAGLGRAPKPAWSWAARGSAIVAGVVLALWLASGVNGRRLGELDAFLPPADASGKTADGELDWILNDYDTAMAAARLQGARVLVDFTGYTCTNCRWMEANMFPRPDVSRELARYVRLRLYTDGRGELYRRHQALEQRLFGTVALPYYAVFTPDGQPVVAFGGLTRDPAEYIAFLQAGLR
jgi:thiol:disulfide interchange protein DsbD